MVTPQLFIAKVMHKRFFPRVNAFTYKVYYLNLPLAQLEALPKNLVFAVDRPALFSFYRHDYGGHDGGDLRAWAINLFAQYGHKADAYAIHLITMPRIFGYAFNPVSFWMAYDHDQKLRGVIAEVNNTFGETHNYLCVTSDGAPITPQDWLGTEKVFHVSPFLERSGQYAFRFHERGKNLGIWIDYKDAKGERQLATSLIGQHKALSTAALREAFFAIPFVTLKTIALIHWQALVLVFKKVRYICKPPQLAARHSRTQK